MRCCINFMFAPFRLKRIGIIGSVLFDTWPNVCYLSIALLSYNYLLHVHEMVIDGKKKKLVVSMWNGRKNETRTSLVFWTPILVLLVCPFFVNRRAGARVAYTILPWVTWMLYIIMRIYMVLVYKWAEVDFNEWSCAVPNWNLLELCKWTNEQKKIVCWMDKPSKDEKYHIGRREKREP